MDAFQEQPERTAVFNPCLLMSLRFLSSCAAFFVLLAAGAVLVGWVVRADVLLRPEYSPLVMRPNSALAFVLCTLALWTGAPGNHGLRSIIPLACSGVVFMVGLATVIENLFSLYLPTDVLLVPPRVHERFPLDPWRMALVSGLALIFLSVALLAALRKTEYSARASQFLAGMAFLAAVLGLMDQILNPEVSQLHIPLATVICLGLMSFAIFLRRPDEGFMKIVAADGLGGSMARRLVPAALLVSVVITWVRWRGQSHGYYDPELGAAVGVAIQIVLFTWLILANANYLERTDQLRKRAEEVARVEHEKNQQRSANQIMQLVTRTRELEKQLENDRTSSSS